MNRLKITTTDSDAAKIKADAVILPFFEEAIKAPYQGCSAEANRIVAGVIRAGDFSGRHGQTMLLPVHSGPHERILLVGLGKESDLTAERLRRAGAQAFNALRGTPVRSVMVGAHVFDAMRCTELGIEPCAFYLLEGGLLRRYSFERYRTAPRQNGGDMLQSILVAGEKQSLDTMLLQVSVEANAFVRDLVLTPAGDLAPADLAEAARKAAGKNTKVRVLDRKAIVREGMDALHAVGRGSRREERLIIMDYKGAKGAPLVVIGKGITFDSGGISLKSADGMEKMKYDMAGGAAVIGLIKAISALRIKRHVVGIIPAAENLPGGDAFRPGDIVRTLAGKTVEIVSTDAEGRLLLADAMAYARKHFAPRCMLDIATLTGACSIAFGHEAIAVMGTSPGLIAALRRAGEETYERIWELPLFEEYGESLKGDVADIKNAAGRKGSLIAAASFLKEFAGDTPWAHLDIAGTAWIDKDKPYCAKGATGVGVRLLLAMLRSPDNVCGD
ncbi:MAG TPA: leucyl aminopeptidase [Dissulfurispiraceae bacterium]|nr:leucyl aminopeptidase [Dissulfurispiraceae bacterium]